MTLTDDEAADLRNAFDTGWLTLYAHVTDLANSYRAQGYVSLLMLFLGLVNEKQHSTNDLQGSWVCGRCQLAPETHASSACVYDPAFIAAANPAAVLGLLDEVEALRAQVERVANEISRYARWSREVADESPDRAIAYQIVARRLRAALDGPQS